jgi:hypothetical protein
LKFLAGAAWAASMNKHYQNEAEPMMRPLFSCRSAKMPIMGFMITRQLIALIIGALTIGLAASLSLSIGLRATFALLGSLGVLLGLWELARNGRRRLVPAA